MAQQGILFALTCVGENTQALEFHQFIPERDATSKVTLNDNKLKMCDWNGVPGGPYSIQQRMSTCLGAMRCHGRSGADEGVRWAPVFCLGEG